MSRWIVLLLTLTGLLIAVVGCALKPSPTPPRVPPTPPPDVLRAGLRASTYGPQPPFPDPAYWVNTAGEMASRFEGAVPAVVWISSTACLPGGG